MHNQGDLRRIRLFPSGKDIADPVELTANAPDIDIPMPSASEKIHSPIAVAAQDVRRRRTETGATPEQSVFQKKKTLRGISDTSDEARINSIIFFRPANRFPVNVEKRHFFT